MNPIFLGRAQCFDINSQCLSGEEYLGTLLNNPDLEKAFEEGCGTLNPENKIIRCCPLSLINQPYIPREGKIPIHTKKVGNEHRLCPESIRSECVRETDPVRFISCIAEKCNDAGYLEADNYYQVCKAYKSQGSIESVPDCPIKKCPIMMTIPDWYKDLLDGKSSSTPPSSLITPSQPVVEVIKKEDQGFSLKKLFGYLPTEKNFYSWGSLILGLIAFIIIISLFFVVKKPRNYVMPPNFTTVF